MADPFATLNRARASFRSTKSSTESSSTTTTGKFLSKADYVKAAASSSSTSKLYTSLRSTPVATKRPIIQREDATPARWFNSSFDEDIQIIDEKPPKKRGKYGARKVVKEKAEQKKQEVAVNDENMPLIIGNAGMFEPKNIEDLAVNSKKIDEVREWIQGMMTPIKCRKILLLSGPCGCGKTTTLKLLCEDLGIDFVEFDLPQDGDFIDYNDQAIYAESKPFEVFERFVKACEFSSTEPGAPQHRLLCIESLPNIFYRDPAKLKESLLRCASSTRCMIVFVMSTSDKGWEFCPARLFPSTLMNELQISDIKFNSIAPSFMTKAVHKMIDMMNIKATSSMVKEIVEQADGDIRAVISNIQFSTLKKSYNGGLSAAINHITTFHYIGKIMYAKRAEIAPQEWRTTENKIKSQKWIRHFPPKDNLNYLVDNCVFSGSRLSDYVFEHEPNFAPSITACSRVLRDLAEFDAISQLNTDYERTSMINKYSVDIAVRTTIFNNCQSAAGQAKISKTRHLYQFKKPQLVEMTRTAFATKLNLVKLLPGLRTSDLFTTTVPLIARTKFFMRPEEKKIINALSLQDKISSTKNWGGLRVKVNPPLFSKNLGSSGKLSPLRTKPYMPDAIEEKEEEYEIFESDDEPF